MYQNIHQIIQQGEGLTIEFKRAKDQLPANLFETVCAFLNRSGGNILLGVNDDKTIEGVNPDKAEELCKDFTNLSNNPQKLFPTFLLDAHTVILKKKTLVHIFVPISSQVHKCNNKIYDRSADGDFTLNTSEQIKNLYNRKSILYTENKIYPYLNEDHFVKGIVDRTRRIIKNNRPDHPWNDLSNHDFYITTGLYRTDLITGLEGFTMSALLLFARDEVIQSAIPHYKIDALLRIENMDRYDDRENIRCNIIGAYDRLMVFVAKHLPDKFYLEGDQRISLREKIFREILANMLIHREYSNAFPSTFTIYKDRVETKNANKPIFIGQLLPGKFEPFPKNPNIAQIYTQMGRSEELGTGVRNVFKYSKAYSGSDEILFQEDDVFTTKVPLPKLNDPVNDPVIDPVIDPVNRRQNLIVEIMKKDKNITRESLATKCNVSVETIKRDIRTLKQLGKIKRVGADKTGYWHVIE